MGTACDLRKVVFQARPGKDSLTRKKGLMSHFRKWDNSLLFMNIISYM
jgi:hypothetical protein